MTGAHTDEVWYEIDAHDRICAVGGGWAAFSRAHGGGALDGARVIGSHAFGHIAGHFTKRFFREFIGRARLAAQTRRAYGCDAPGLNRLIEMRATPVGAGRVRISLAVIEETAITSPVETGEAPRRALAGYLRCSLCNRLRLRSDDAWREPDEAMAEGGSARVVHTVCPPCRGGVQASALWARQSRAARAG